MLLAHTTLDTTFCRKSLNSDMYHLRAVTFTLLASLHTALFTPSTLLPPGIT